MIKVNVTERHIKLGKKVNCELCPVAIALCEATGLDVSVSGIYARLKMPKLGKSICIALAGHVRQWIGAFDDNNYVEPFSFVLKGDYE